MASALVELLGESLQGASGLVDTASALAGKQVIALYFSAHWCPPCRGFTPQLAEWYAAALKEKGLEVVFVSSDRSEGDFDGYFKEMPWLALPFADRDRKAKLSKKFKVEGIPSLVLLGADGKTITKNGRAAVSSDPTGENFPWIPKSPAELLGGAKLVTKAGEEMSIAEAAKGKSAVALYFSAHWCPPCRGFTPKLAEWYSADLSAKGMEVVFISWDRSEDAFKEYFNEMPWLALDYSDRKLSQALGPAFEVEGIPSLVVLDGDLKLVTTEGRGAVSADPKGLEMPWYPKPVKDLHRDTSAVQEAPTVIVFCETQDKAQQAALEEALTPVAKKLTDEEGNAETVIMLARTVGGVGEKVRSMIGLPALEGADGAAQPLAMALLDLSEGAYFMAAAGAEITAASVEKFVADFSAGALEKKSLQ